MKKFYLVLFSIFIMFISSSCGNKEKSYLKNDQENFQNNVEDIISIINNVDISEYQNDHNIYKIGDNYLTGLNYNTKNLKYDFIIQRNLGNYNIDNGIIVQMNNKDLYVSIEGSDFCAIKDFNDSSVSIYTIDEKEKCHKLYVLDDEWHVYILAINLEDSSSNYGIYESGTISNGYVKLSSSANLLDELAVTYQWYRNDEKLEDGNVMDYTIISDHEDADYYVEVTAPDGTSYKSETVNVKIERAN